MGTGGMTEGEEAEASGGTCEQSFDGRRHIVAASFKRACEFCSEEWDTFDL